MTITSPRLFSLVWTQRLLTLVAAIVIVSAVLLACPIVHTDAGEMAVWITSLIWEVWGAYATCLNWAIWNELHGPDERALQAIALRRVRNQAFQTAIAGIVWIGTTVTLFYPIGESQNALRTYTLVVTSVLFSYRSFLEHMEQRSVDSRGIELPVQLR